MTDRELLETAAKAVGYEIDGYSERYGALVSEADGVSMWWNPFTNDEEALRLVVKLGIHITNNQSDARATALDAIAIEPLINDPTPLPAELSFALLRRLGSESKEATLEVNNEPCNLYQRTRRLRHLFSGTPCVLRLHRVGPMGREHRFWARGRACYDPCCGTLCPVYSERLPMSRILDAAH